MFIRPKLVILCILAAIMAVSGSSVNRAGADTAEKTIIAFGDSLVAGYGVETGEAFPAQLEKKLKDKGHAVKVVNAGVSGDTTADALNRLEWLLKRQKAGYAIVVLGGNDMLRALDPALTRANLQKIMEIFKKHDIHVLLAGMRAYKNLGASYAESYDSLFRETAEAYGALYYPFFLEGVAMKDGYNQEDGAHPNAAGVGVIAGNILPLVETLLAKAPRT
jgi:acyl-CoA thioesterase I